MAAAPPGERIRFEVDLAAAHEIASQRLTGKTRQARDRLFANWCDFCASLSVNPSLDDVPDPEAKLSYLLVYGIRIRQRAGSSGKPIRAGTVEDTLLAVGKGIADLGQPDPRKQVGGGGQNHPLLTDFIASLKQQDDPSSRSYPANITIIAHLYNILETTHPIHGRANLVAIYLTVVGFYWLLRPSEYLHTNEAKRSSPFRFCDVTYTTAANATYVATDPSLNDVTEDMISSSSLTFTDQKNAVRGEQISHSRTDNPDLCPCVCLYRITEHLRAHNADHDTPICTYWDGDGKRQRATSPLITNALRHSAADLESLTGIPPKLLSARSLRPGGATALLCANIDSDVIKLLGRWKSDAMFRYLRAQAHIHSAQFSQKMLNSGRYTFAPQPADVSQPIPREAPAGFVDILNEA